LNKRCNALGYQGRFKSFIKTASYSRILFHKKHCINEPTIKPDDNSLYPIGMTTLTIPKGNHKEIINLMNSSYTFIIEVEIVSFESKHWSRFTAGIHRSLTELPFKI
jgi:hypothetical protein